MYSNPSVWTDIAFPSKAAEDELKDYITKRLTPQRVKVLAELEVTCFSYEGIDGIIKALRAAQDKSTKAVEISAKVISAPHYVLSAVVFDKDEGIAVLQEAIECARESIVASKGNLKVKTEPKAVTDRDEAELQALMEERARENAEVPGDDSVSESDDEAPRAPIQGSK